MTRHTPVELSIKAAMRTRGYRIVNQDGFRFFIRRTAFHEAAHIAASMFTGLEANHVVRVTIIPDAGTLGRAISERCMAEQEIETLPSPLQRTTGRRLLLSLLAGRGSDYRISPVEVREEIVQPDSAEFGDEGSDLFRAKRIADIMARPGMNARQVLEQAGEWTREMLQLPAVWNCVERLGNKLIKDGSIESKDEIHELCEDILYLGNTLQPWRQRFSLTKTEHKSVYRNVSGPVPG